MKILLDQNMPEKIRLALRGHFTIPGRAMGWSRLENGDLIAAAERNGFDAMLSADQSIVYQQNNDKRLLALVVLSTNDWSRIREYLEPIIQAVERCKVSSFEEVPIPPDTRMRR